jgi:hypothetical protein
MATSALHVYDHANPLLREPAVIPGLPDNLRVVPDDPERWSAWSQAVAAYRKLRRRECERDTRQQDIEYERCRRDAAYFITMWGVVFEPRKVADRPPEWKPFVLFASQVRFVRWIDAVNAQEDKGRGDGVVEKSRDMGATNIFCAYAVHHFLFHEVFICGFISRNFELVYRKNASDTIFYKLQALLGVEDGVPPALKLPRFLQPAGFAKELHVAPGAITNPEEGRTCFLVGETTTKLAGVGGRSTMRVNDEAARFDAFGEAWSNQQATTDHRFALSSADMKSPEFYDMARLGEECLIDPDKDGPSFIKLTWDMHPFHTDEWFARQRARAASDGTLAKFQREYEIDYFAGLGDHVYPRFRSVVTPDAPYDPHGGPMYCFVDPGTRDPAALIYVQADLVNGGWNVVEAFEGLGGEDVSFYASVMTGIYLSGEHQYDYDIYPGVHELMQFTSSIRLPITYIGDPDGNKRGAGGDETATWYKQLTLAARKLGNRTIFVQSITADDARAFNTRITATNELLPYFRFHRAPGPSRVLFCLQSSRYQSGKGRVETREPLKPLHDEYSHTRTAFEYGCVWLQRTQMRERRGPVQAARVSLAGNIVSGRQRELFGPRR